MKRIKSLCMTLFMLLTFVMLNAQTNITTKLELTKPLGESTLKEFQSRIFKAALAGKLVVFKDDSLTMKMNINDIRDRLNNDEVIQVFPDPNDPGFAVDSVIKKTLTEKDISCFLACAIFTPDYRNRQYTVKYRALAVSMRISKAGYDLGEQPVFWFSFNSLAGLFSAPEIEKFRKAIRTSTESFYYGEKPVTGNTIQKVYINKYIGKNALLMFNRKIYAGLVGGRLPGWSDNGFTTALTPEEISVLPGTRELVQRDGVDTVYTTPLNPDSICMHFITGQVDFDENQFSFSVVLNGMAQGYYLTGNFEPKEEIISWIKFTDLARFVGDTEYSGLFKIFFKATKDQFDVYSAKD